MSLSPEQEKKIKRLATALDGKEVGVLTVLNDVESALESKIEALESQLPALREAKDGEDGYTPVKNVDYFDGKDGYTPIKGVDYFDGKDGKDSTVAGPKGEKGDKGDSIVGPMGPAGQDGKDGFVDVATIAYLEDKAKSVEKLTTDNYDGLNRAIGIIDQRSSFLINKTNRLETLINEAGPGGATAWGAITGTLEDQTDLQTVLDGKVDENVAITGATKTKITYDAKGLVTAGADATTADIADSLNKRYVTDANLTTIGNQSGTNTGDQTIKDTFGITVDGAGVALTTGTKGYRYIEQNCTITGWDLRSDISGSVVFNVKRGGVSLAGSEKPTLTASSSNQDLALSTWTTSLLAGDIIEFVIDSASTLTRATATILITKT